MARDGLAANLPTAAQRMALVIALYKAMSGASSAERAAAPAGPRHPWRLPEVEKWHRLASRSEVFLC
jgi:hypothetical protein